MAARRARRSAEIEAGPSLSSEPAKPPVSRQQAVTDPVPQSRVVSKPVPIAQQEDPREFQMGQVRRRFSPKETQLVAGGLTDAEAGTRLDFSITPSDPDFPFEMDILQCSLTVPMSYPQSKPSLRVRNNDIPRGFAINIERGFQKLVQERNDMTLLAFLSALDKNLEAFLSEKKAETVKLVPNADRRHLAELPIRALHPLPVSAVTPERAPQVPFRSRSPEYFTAEQKVEAQKRREVETRQLEARLGRLSSYKKASDGIAYTLPMEPRKRSELPQPLQSLQIITLFVPLLYPLEGCRIKLDGVKPEDARTTEAAFEEKAKQSKHFNLMAHINGLAQNMHIMAKATSQANPVIESPVGENLASAVTGDSKQAIGKLDTDDDRSHIKIIPRPPEWTIIDTSDLSESDDDYSYDTGDESDDGGTNLNHEEDTAQAPAPTVERGTALSFPFIELYGIELLEVTTLSLTVKCERCKEVTEIVGLQNAVPKTESCRKCAINLTVGFRKDLVHINAVRAGFLDLEGCTVVDMLPSSFTPTCSICSTPYPAPGIISVRGETTTNICRECHGKLTFKIPDLKFLRITSSHLPPTSGPRRKRETLGLIAGTELPKRGRCKHYSKSYRWFRFSCCQKVYSCDRCHDEVEEHPNEHANRMICGFCSREQNYRPEDCAVCHAVLVGRKGHGFWEGGKGTRDRVVMSKKDKRKFRRPGGEKT